MKTYSINFTGTTTDRAREDLARALADKHATVHVFFAPGEKTAVTPGGRLAETCIAIPDRDAVQVPADADEKRITYLRALAAGRETVRHYEDLATGILEKRPEDMTDAERLALLSCVNVAFHNGGKIDGIWSLDGSVSCEFCSRMRAAAALELLIICGGCYAAADGYKEFTQRRHRLNARILSTVLFTAQELKRLEIPFGARVRINEDGDTVNAIHARNIIHLFDARPDCMFGYWYKNMPAVRAGLAAEGVTDRAGKLARFPHVRFIHSSPLIGFRVTPTFFDDATFTVYPDQVTTDAAIAAGAWPCNGRKCRDCGYWCYTPEHNGGTVPDIAELLRCPKAKRAAYVAAWRARKAQQERTA